MTCLAEVEGSEAIRTGRLCHVNGGYGVCFWQQMLRKGRYVRFRFATLETGRETRQSTATVGCTRQKPTATGKVQNRGCSTKIILLKMGAGDCLAADMTGNA